LARPTHVVINRHAMAHNLGIVRKRAPQSRVLAMIKANAYGHGIAAAVNAFADADAFGVASADEARAIRELGCDKRIVLLQGVFSSDELQFARQHHCDIVVHSHWQLKMLEQADQIQALQCWLKINTGMNRLGFSLQDVPSAFQLLSRLTKTPIVMSHFATADEPNSAFMQQQVARFQAVCADLRAPLSLANSAAILSRSDLALDWVRPGIMLYGIAPFAQRTGHEFALQPAMQCFSQIQAIQQCQAGAQVGYGGRFICQRDSKIAVVPIGYGDGYPRYATDQTPAAVNGKNVRLAGRISMDMLTLDVTDHACEEGDLVELWGDNIAIEAVAYHAATIPYELICQITPRVRRMVI
jgi:alanine racemase